MKKTIWKFVLEAEDYPEIDMPVGAQVLAVQTQKERACIWALVNPAEQRRQTRKFLILGTGHQTSDENLNGAQFLGTFQMLEGALVFHVFELDAPPRN